MNESTPSACRTHRLRRFGLLALVAIALAAAGGQTDLIAEEGKVLVILEEEEPQTTYPLLAKTMSEQRLGELLFDRLFVESFGGGTDTKIFEEGWRARAPNLTLIVKEDLKFSDGSPATFSDVAFTINDVYRKSGLGHSVADWYSRVFGDAQQIAKRAGSIRFLISMPDQGAERYLQTTYLLSREALSGGSGGKPDLERTKRQPRGTGPFFPEAVIENFDDIRLRRNPHRPGEAREGRTPVDQIRLLYDQDAARQRELMQGSRADIWVAPPAAVLPPFRNQRERFATRSYDLNQWWYVALNHTNGHLAAPAVREALDSLLPRKQLIDKFGGEETAQLTSGPFLPGSAWESPDTAPTAKDRSRAEQLLNSAGYRKEGGTWLSKEGDALTLRLGVQSDILDDYNDVVYAIQDSWESFGLRIRVRGIRASDWEAATERGGAGNLYDMILGRWNVDREEASLELFRKAGSYGAQTNLFDWSSPEVEKLLADFYSETSGPVREALMQKLHRHIAGERPYLFLWTLQVQSLYRRDRISGFRPSSFYYYSDIGRVTWRDPPKE
jgi:peptide/nickel transport system substrate-binding protein